MRSGLRWAAAAIAALGLVLALGGAAPARAEPLVLVAAIDDQIGPATETYVARAIGEAERRKAELLILRLDTPGGLVDSTRTVVEAILASTVPVIAYVAPPGARAASAGTIILYATHVAAMAPATHLGAATPVLRFGELSPTMRAKAVNDMVAWVRGLAQLRGRNVEWAERAVRESLTLTAGEARDARVIEIVAPDMGALLQALDGRTVEVGGAARTLRTAGAVSERFEVDWLGDILAALADPDVAFVLTILGIIGLVFEIATPGALGPGIVGALLLVLGLYGLSGFPIDAMGVGLVALGIGLMIAEAFIPAFGILGVAGLVAFAFGARQVIDAAPEGFQVSWLAVVAVGVAGMATLAFGFGYVWRQHRRPTVGPTRDEIGREARVLEWSDDEGFVWAEGERWHARATTPPPSALKPGDIVRVRERAGLTLIVEAMPTAWDRSANPGGS